MYTRTEGPSGNRIQKYGKGAGPSEVLFREAGNWIHPGAVPFGIDHVGFLHDGLVYEACPPYEFSPLWDPDACSGMVNPDLCGVYAVNTRGSFQHDAPTAVGSTARNWAFAVPSDVGQRMVDFIKTEMTETTPDGLPYGARFLSYNEAEYGGLIGALMTMLRPDQQKGRQATTPNMCLGGSLDRSYTCVGLVERAAEEAGLNGGEGFIPNAEEEIRVPQNSFMGILTPSLLYAFMNPSWRAGAVRSVSDNWVAGLIFGSVEYALIDPAGRRLGWSAAAGAVDEIPRSFFTASSDVLSGHSGVEQFHIVGAAEGTYRLELRGTGARYAVAVGGSSEGFKDEGYLAAGEVKRVEVEVGPVVENVRITGTVSGSCRGGLPGVMVGLRVNPGEPAAAYFTTLTGNDGRYAFDSIPAGGTAEVSIVIPLGFVATIPPAEGASVPLDGDHVLDFAVGCVQASGQALGMGYWKHQVSVYLTGRGQAQESRVDMETNYPQAIFGHFHENELNDIVVEGVTYREQGGHVPLNLMTMDRTFALSNGRTMLDKAKQQYLPSLLNVASGKLLTYSVVSVDGRTASQALQYVADLINDGQPGNDERAKNISETINEAQLVGAGVIPDGYATVYYARPREGELGLSIAPNPGGPQGYTVSFGMPVKGQAELVVYDVGGRRVATIVSGNVEAGSHREGWQGLAADGHRLAQGVYFLRLTTPKGARTAKFVHLGR